MKKIKLFLALGLMLLSLNAQAGKKIDISTLTANIIVLDGDTLVGSMEDPATAHKISIDKNATVLLDNISINHSGNLTKSTTELGSGLSCYSNSTIIIKGNCYVTCCYVWSAGIYVSNGLTIKEHESGGRLEVSGASYGPGIGTWGNTEWPDGSLTIESGTIIATGAGNSPGIGPCAGSGGNTSTFGNIYIKGGNITAVGGKAAAGIGAGWNSECGEIVITGGKITASSTENASNYAAAIGGAHNGNCGNITFTAQAGVPIEVNVTKAANASYCIGSGSGTSTCGNLTMDGNPVGYINSSIYYYDATYIGYEGPIVWTKNLVTMEASYGLASGYTGTSLEVPATYTDWKTREFAVTKLDGYAFDGYASLTEIILPASIKKIAQNAFEGCTGLEVLKCQATVPPTLESDALEGLPKTAIIRVPNDKIEAYKAADGWKDFASQIRGLVYTVTKEIDGINYSLNLESMTATVVALDDSKKYKDTIVIPESVKYESKSYDVKEIGENAFNENSDLKGVDIPATIANIGAQAFAYCTSLNFFICRASIAPTVQSNTFQNVNKAAKKPLFVPEASMDDYSTYDYWKDFDVRNLEVYEKRLELHGIIAEMYNLFDDGVGILTDAELAPINDDIAAAFQVANNEAPTLTQTDVDNAIGAANNALSTRGKNFLTKAKEHADALKADLVLMKNAADQMGATDLGSTIQGQILVLAASVKEPTTLGKVRDAYVTAKGQLEADITALVEAARAAAKAQLDALLTKDDSQECIDIIEGYKADVDAQIVWNDGYTVEMNINDSKINAGAIYTKAQNDLKIQRDKEAAAITVWTCDFTTKATSHNKYTDSWVYDGKWTVFGGSNNNGSWGYVKMGGNKDNIATANPVYVANKDALGKDIQVISVSYPDGSFPTASKMGVNEWGVKVYKTPECKEADLLYTVKGDAAAITNKAATLTLKPEAGQTWAAGCGFQVYWDIINTSTTNGTVFVEKIEFNADETSTGMDNVQSDNVQNAKILRNGQLFILRDGKMYTISGAEVK